MLRRLFPLLSLVVVFLFVVPSTADARHRRYYVPYYPTYVGAPFHSYYTGDYGYGGWSRFDHPYYRGISVGGPFAPYYGGYAPFYVPRHYGYGYPYGGYGGIHFGGYRGGISIFWR